MATSMDPVDVDYQEIVRESKTVTSESLDEFNGREINHFAELAGEECG